MLDSCSQEICNRFKAHDECGENRTFIARLQDQLLLVGEIAPKSGILIINLDCDGAADVTPRDDQPKWSESAERCSKRGVSLFLLSHWMHRNFFRSAQILLVHFYFMIHCQRDYLLQVHNQHSVVRSAEKGQLYGIYQKRPDILSDALQSFLHWSTHDSFQCTFTIEHSLWYK